MAKFLIVVVFSVAAVVAAWLWARQFCCVTHGELKSTVKTESAEIRTKIDRCYEALDVKLDRIEAKLDKLINLATPKLPDGMRVAE